jgi:hypothetical protein
VNGVLELLVVADELQSEYGRPQQPDVPAPAQAYAGSGRRPW